MTHVDLKISGFTKKHCHSTRRVFNCEIRPAGALGLEAPKVLIEMKISITSFDGGAADQVAPLKYAALSFSASC